ncbi:MAG: selenide, water dikinase SelD [Chitinophagaceae bacterium]
MDQPIKLTQFSHGAGCGCKISPRILDKILESNLSMPDNNKLLVGNHSKDDAAVFDIGNGTALIATTDFFMPIVDDPFQFGRIASANAISDIYAMGGKPVLAIAILGWPVNVIPPEIAQRVIEGSRSMCLEAGIPLAGGHSIDSPEPIFGLAVNGLITINHIKKNNQAKAGNVLLLTKPLGVGILTTAEKKGILKQKHLGLAATQMMQLNKVGEALGTVDDVVSMTDVTGFGLLGHLVEMTEGAGVSAQLFFEALPLITEELSGYVEQKSVPGGTQRNLESYGEKIHYLLADNIAFRQAILADPQTSGGLLISVDTAGLKEVEAILTKFGLSEFTKPIGLITAKGSHAVMVM